MIGKQEKASLELNKLKLLETSNSNPMLNDRKMELKVYLLCSSLR